MTEFIQRAALYSRAAHTAVGQLRKYTNEPYWHHPAAVAALIQGVRHTEEMVAAAFLHDVVEDTAVTIADIEREFGTVVGSYVFELTDQFTNPALGNRETRKAMERERLAGIHPNAQTIKYADLIDNTSSIVAHDQAFARVYLNEKRKLLNVMVDGDQELWQRAWAAMVEGERKLKEWGYD